MFPFHHFYSYSQNLDQSDRMVYEAAAALEMKQYRHDLERWQLKQKLKQGHVGLTKTIVAKPKNDLGEGVEKSKTEDNGTGALCSKSTQGQDFSAPLAKIANSTSTSFASAFNPNIQLDFTPLPHTSLPFATSAKSLYHPFQQDQLPSATAGAHASATYANNDEAPVRKSSSASNLSFLVEAGLLPASIMEEDCGGFFASGIPHETQQELCAKTSNMSTVFDDDIVDFLASPEDGLPFDQLQEKPQTTQADPYPTINIPNSFVAFGGVRQDEASAPPAAGQVTYERAPAAPTHPQGAHEEAKANTADQRMVPVPEGQKVPFTARSA